jgi:hypothetical protein
MTIMEEATKTITLQFLRSELLNDLDQYGFVEGDVQRADADHLKHGKHQTQDITQDGNINLVTRWLDLALARCREALFPYSKSPVENGTEMDDVLVDTDYYTIELVVPEDFSQTTVDYLEQQIHHLMIWWVLYYWLSITKPDAAAKWLASAQSTEEDIKGTLARRCGRTRRPIRPFS